MDWRYVAGFFDGEGSIVATPVHRHRVFITQTNEEVLKEIQSFTGIGSVASIAKRKKHWKDAWIYYIARSENVSKFLRGVEPHLIVKKQLAAQTIHSLEIIEKERKKQKRMFNLRVKEAKRLRRRGLAYREIGRILSIDFGHARRLIKFC